MKRKTSFFLLCFALVSFTSQAQKGVFTYGVFNHGLYYGGEESLGISNAGMFIGKPFRLNKNERHQLVLQPDLALGYTYPSLFRSDNYARFSYFLGPTFGANVALKYSLVGNLNRFSFGLRSGYNELLGLYGFMLEYDRKIGTKTSLGINLCSQTYFGSYSEGFAGVKVQVSRNLFSK